MDTENEVLKITANPLTTTGFLFIISLYYLNLFSPHHISFIMLNEIRKPDAKLLKILPPAAPRAGITYRPSRFILPFEHKGKAYVFHILTKQCIAGSLPPSVRAGEGFDELIAAQFLVPVDKDECVYYNSISALMRTYRRKKGIRSYTILPTLGCNARCVYCYEEGMKPVAMTAETVEQTIRFILDTRSDGPVSLHWFGGEPLLGVPVIDRICEGMREAGLTYHSGMISNGSLITPEILSKMKGAWKLNNIQISMDGAETDYRARKRYYRDGDAYHDVMKSVSALSEAGIQVTIRCNVDEENWAGIPQFLEDLRSGVAHKEKVSIYFAPLNAVRMGPDDLSVWEKIRDGTHWIDEAGFRATPFLGLGMDFRVYHCMADGDSVVIAPDGGLYPCEHCPPESRYGDIWNGTTDESAKRDFCRVDRTREKCRECPFLPDCTSFAACPVEDTHCRAVREMMAVDELRRMVDQKESEAANGEHPIC